MLKIYAFADEASSNIDEQIKACVKHGLCGIELRNIDGESVSEITAYKAKEVDKKLKANGLGVYSIGSPIGKIDIQSDKFEEHLDKFKHTLEIAHLFGAENMRIFSFFIPSGELPYKYRDEVMERLGRLVEESKGSNVTLCHENEKNIYGESESCCLDILKNLPDIKGIFDPANFIQGNVDTFKAWELLKPYIKYLHIKDATADKTIVPAGMGIGNVKHILCDFIGMGGNVVTVEPHLAVFSGFNELERSGESKRKFVYDSQEKAFDVAVETLKEMEHAIID